MTKESFTRPLTCYQCEQRVSSLVWRSRCVKCVIKNLEANLEENDMLRAELAALINEEPGDET